MPGKPVTWRRGPGVFTAVLLIAEVAGEHFGAPWPDSLEAERRVRVIQEVKLHQWAKTAFWSLLR